MLILLHSSKTMRGSDKPDTSLEQPLLLNKSQGLIDYLKTLSTAQIIKSMHISEKVAVSTQQLISGWHSRGSLAAIDSFRGDIYSGFQTNTLSAADRKYANQKLRILSGLYGSLRPLDAINPYRLELGYRLPDEPYRNLYNYWGSAIADSLPNDEVIINTSSAEYTKAVLPYKTNARVITPQFLTVSPKTSEPLFVVVHAKIARGAFARWMIVNRIEEVADLARFDDLGYVYNAELSTPDAPVYICTEFGGIGLSVRLED